MISIKQKTSHKRAVGGTRRGYSQVYGPLKQTERQSIKKKATRKQYTITN
jgi:hypothetical protein